MVECSGLENRRAERSRGFESRPLRHAISPLGIFVPSGFLYQTAKGVPRRDAAGQVLTARLFELVHKRAKHALGTA